MRVLVPVDLQALSDTLVAHAAAWAQRFGASGEPVVLDLLYVDETALPRPHVAAPEVQTILDREWARARQEHTTRLEALRERLPPSRRGEVKLATGGAAHAVCDLAVGYELILVGTQQREGLSRLWLGSVAERIVQLSPRPVFVLPLGSA
jgi:nucleotide-binding universal stress UspA family protein